jgi:hypothetical protein
MRFCDLIASHARVMLYLIDIKVVVRSEALARNLPLLKPEAISNAVFFLGAPPKRGTDHARHYFDLPGADLATRRVHPRGYHRNASGPHGLRRLRLPSLPCPVRSRIPAGVFRAHQFTHLSLADLGGQGYFEGLWRSEVATASQRTVGLPCFSGPFLTSLLVHGLASGEKNPIGRSREVRNPAGASKITGIEFTTTDAVAMSPCEPPGITRLMFG